MKSLGYFHVEDAEQLIESFRQNGIEAKSESFANDGTQFPIIPNIRSNTLELKAEPGYFEILVPESLFSQAQSIRRQAGVETIQEGLAKLPISEKNLNTVLEIGKAGSLFSALISGGSAKERGGSEMGLLEWYQYMKILFHKDTFLYFQKSLKRKMLLVFVSGSGISLLISWLYFGIYKSTSFNFGYLLLGWLELFFLILAAVLKERFGSILGFAFGAIGTLSILLAIFALSFLN